MAKAKKKSKAVPSVYEGYDIRWLKRTGEAHPDYKLVAEFEKKFGIEIK